MGYHPLLFRFARLKLCQLSSDHTGNELCGVGIGEEAGRVGFDLLKAESRTGVDTIGQDAGGEWAGQAADRATDDFGVVADGAWVGQGDARWSGCTLGGFVDVGGGFGQGLIVARHAGEGYVLISHMKC